jgi:hypothetical protein
MPRPKNAFCKNLKISKNGRIVISCTISNKDTVLFLSDDNCKTWKTINTPSGGNMMINDISIHDETIYILGYENMFKLTDSGWQLVNTPTITDNWIGMDNRIGFSIYTQSGDIYFKLNENDDYKLSVNFEGNGVIYNVLGSEYILTSSGLFTLQ